MSLTSYRAAPPRVKTIRKREARAPPAVAYLAIAIRIEKAAAVGGRWAVMGKSSTTHGLISW